MRLEERFWSKVDQSGGPDACWLWTAGTVRHGYGRMSVPPRGNSARSNRLAWELAIGPIPDGMAVLHQCDNPPCCNPAHLFLGSQADNLADMRAKSRGVVPPRGEHGRFNSVGLSPWACA